MNPGLIALLAALVATVVIAVVMQRRNGRFRQVGTASAVAPPTADAGEDAPEEDDPAAESRTLVVTADEIGAPLGERLTLLQFSSAFCSPCRATRTLLADVTADRDDVAHVEIDAESHLELVRRVNVLRTPTVLVLDGAGTVVGRASGVPRREQVLAVVDGDARSS